MLSEDIYLIFDAARMGKAIEKAIELNPIYESLYKGDSKESLKSVAPYLFLSQNNTELMSWYMRKGWGESWGIMFKSKFSVSDVHKHFRKFLLVNTEDNRQLYFRFYDPRALRIFLLTCNKNQLAEFFAMIDYFIVEDEDKDFGLKYWLQNDGLHTLKIKLDDLFYN